MNSPALPLRPRRGTGIRTPAPTRKPTIASLCVAFCIAGVVRAEPFGVAADPAHWAAAQISGNVQLVQRARLSSSAGPVTIAINFSPSAWHLDSIDGPEATAAQLRSALDALRHIVITGRCRDAASDALDRPCPFRLGAPDFAGIVNPNAAAEVFGWVATERWEAPGGAADASAAAMRYFGLLSPTRYAGPSGSGATVALRYDDPARTLMPSGFDPKSAALVLQTERMPQRPPMALRGTP